MANTRNILDTINWSEPFVNYKPNYLGNNGEPGLSNANLILQTMLGPPFIWRWNRASTPPFTSTIGATDNKVSLPTFGWLEKAYLQQTTAQGPTGKTFEIPEIVSCLGPAVEEDRPQSICALLDDNAGNITFRVSPAYDLTYLVTLIFQQKAPLMSSLASPWTPIPDELAFIYNHGFLALELLFADDPRFQIINARFVGSLLATAEGITEMQRNAFLDRWNNQIGQLSSDQARRQQGERARQS